MIKYIIFIGMSLWILVSIECFYSWITAHLLKLDQNTLLYNEITIYISLQLIYKQEKHYNYILFNLESKILTPGTLKLLRKPKGEEVLDLRVKLAWCQPAFKCVFTHRQMLLSTSISEASFSNDRW